MHAETFLASNRFSYLIEKEFGFFALVFLEGKINKLYIYIYNYIMYMYIISVFPRYSNNEETYTDKCTLVHTLLNIEMSSFF